MTFWKWLWQDEENGVLLALSTLIIAVAFIWLKFIYPFPNFMPPDSANYIEAADRKDFINIWPTGYSYFLRIIHSVTSSHLILVIVQYILLMASVLYFLFTIRYLLSPGIWMFRILLLLCLCNPLLPHIANFISSDCLFVILSLLWISQLFWIVYKPNLKLLLLHALILGCLFTVRYMSLYYPIISISVIILTTMPRIIKRVGIASAAVLILALIGYSQYEYKQKTTVAQYSAFGGWQLAANALYAYSHATPIGPENVHAKFKLLHTIVNRDLDSLRQLRVRPDEEIGIYYLWSFRSPLREYMRQINKDTSKSFFYQWARLGPSYGEYGRFLIANYPRLYVRYFVWPNFKRYLIPPPYFMGYYNMGIRSVDSETRRWFQWDTNQLTTKNKSRKIEWMEGVSLLFGIVNALFFILGLIYVLIKKYNFYASGVNRLMKITIAVALVNALFGIFAAPIELRYEVFPMIIMISFTCIFLENLIGSNQFSKWQSKIIRTKENPETRHLYPESRHLQS